MTRLPRAATPEGQAGLDALLSHPRQALIGTDFDGTLAPIVADPRAARALPGAVPALTRLARRSARWPSSPAGPPRRRSPTAGLTPSPASSCSATTAGSAGRTASSPGPARRPRYRPPARPCPACSAAAGAPDGTWVEDKGHALAVHTRRAADPEAALGRLRGPLDDLAARLGLAAEPGRMVIELRPPGVDKGTALTALARERAADAVLFCGDDLGDLPAFAAVRALRAAGIPGCAVASASAESPQVAAAADLVVDGPEGIVALLAAIAAELDR